MLYFVAEYTDESGQFYKVGAKWQHHPHLHIARKLIAAGVLSKNKPEPVKSKAKKKEDS